MKNPKNEKGAITIVALITVLFMMSFLLSTYIVIASKVKTEKEMLGEVKEIYEPKQSMAEIYNSYYGNISNILPQEYQEVEYIESTGTQYIDTMVNVTDLLSFECKWLLTTNANYGLNGAYYYSSDGQKAYCFGCNNTGKLYMGIGRTSNTSYTSEANIIYTTNGDKEHMETRNNLDTYQMMGEFREPNLNFYLFATDVYADNNKRYQGYFSNEKIYYCKLYNENNIIRNFIPCYSTTNTTDVKGNSCPAGTVGLYDTVNNKFYTNEGTGAFIAGPIEKRFITRTINETIPIYTVEQLLAIGTGEQFVINGKIYTFSDRGIYVLKNDLEFDVDNWQDVLGQGNNWLPIGRTNIAFEGNNNKITVTKLDNSVVEYNKDNNYSDSRLSASYQEIEYIESTGTQYIDTGTVPKPGLKGELDLFNISGGYPFGSTNGQNKDYWGINFHKSTSSFECYLGSGSYPKVSSWIENTRYKIIIDDKKFYNGDTLLYDFANSSNTFTFNTTKPIYLFGLNYGNGSFHSFRFYSVKFWDNGTLIQDFIPCKSTTTVTDVKGNSCPAGTVGLYDTVTEEFYTNDGTGTFTAGPDV